MKIIHMIYPVIGIVLALVLCISPVVAVSADDFEIVVDNPEVNKYKYFNVNNQSEKYTEIYTQGTYALRSFVTFKPANIPDAPMMVVNTDHERFIYLPRSVDVWEIKYYTYKGVLHSLVPKYLKNTCTINLNEVFGDHVEDGLWLELNIGQYISGINAGHCAVSWAFFDVPTPEPAPPEPVVPVVAATGGGFEVLINNPKLNMYTYSNVSNPDEKYTEIITDGTRWLSSVVTFKPVGIPDAPTMVVNTDNPKYIYLTKSVDEWEIKYYSTSYVTWYLYDKHLKNAGTINLNKYFGKAIERGLNLELSSAQYICIWHHEFPHYSIPDVD